MFKVVERLTISDELAAASERWLTRNGLPEDVDEDWLELVCEDGDVFRPDNIMLHLAVPPSEVSPGDCLDVGRTPTRRTLGRGILSIGGEPSGQLSFTVLEGDVVAWGSTEALVPHAFTYWLDAGPATALATPLRGASRVVGGLGIRPDLIIRNENDVEARCPVDETGPTPELLPEDYFEQHAQGEVVGLRIDREGGLGRDALAAIANLRPADVTFAVAGDGSLVISGGPDDGEPFTLDGAGITPLGDPRSTPIVVPYVVALAAHDGAVGGAVDLALDVHWGRLHRSDRAITVQWKR